MSGYFYSLILIALLISVLSFIAYRESEVATRFAFGVIMTAAMLLQLADILPSIDIGGIIEDIKSEFEDDPLYSERSEAAIESGIAEAVCEKFSLPKGSVTVTLSGFDFDNMRAENIRLTLSGGAIFSNLEKIEQYVTGLGLGECEVAVEI